MSAHTEFDLGSLIWVKGEIDQALEKARASLDKYAGKSEAAELKFAQTHLHQVRGAVEMVGLAGAARFAEELEVAIGAVERGESSPAALPAVAEAVASLSQYIESLINGSPDLALKLLPAYRRVRQARGEAQTCGADLFFPGLSASLPSSLAPLSLDAEGLAQLQKNARSRFEAGLLKWLKNDKRGGGLLMVQALLGIARGQTGSLQRGFWWAAAALVEGSIDNRAKLDLDLKPVFARINQQLKRLIDGGKVAERLFRDVLYVVATMDTHSVHCAAVREAFGLDALLPAGALEDDAQQLAALQLARELKDQINQAKDNWARIGGGSADKLPAMQQQLAEFAKRGAGLGISGFDTLAGVLAQTVATLKGVPAEDQALEIATAMLLLENALLVFPEQSLEFPAQSTAMQARLQGRQTGQEVSLLDEVSRRAQERLLMGQVAQEILANLSQIEQLLDDFFRDAGTRAELAGTEAPIRQIRGALTMLDERKALALLDHCAEMVRRCRADDYAAPAEELEFLAEALSGLGFYVDALKREEADRSKHIDPWLRQVQGEPAEEPAPVVEEPSIEMELDSEPEPAVMVEAPAPAPAPAPSAPAAVSDAAVDAELLEVYLEEAVEVLDNINQHLDIVREHPANKDAFTVIRRGFHTLKGSGRMVGLNQLGEVAWAVEQVMNKWLQDEKRTTPSLVRLVELASHGFSGWVDELKDHGSAQVEASEIFGLAEMLKSGTDPDTVATEAPAEAASVEEAIAEAPVHADATSVADAATAHEAPVEFDLQLDAPAATHPEPAHAAVPEADFVLDLPEADEAPLLPGSIELAKPEPEPEPTELQIGDISISKALFGIFLDEAYRHFATLNDAFIDFRAHGEVRPEFVHAAHTLCGIANTTGFTGLGELGHAIEQVLLAQQKASGEPALEDRETLSMSIDKVGTMLGKISHYEMPAEEMQTIALLLAQANRLKDEAHPQAAPAPELVLDLPTPREAEPAAAAPPPHADISIEELSIDFHEADRLELDVGHAAEPDAEHFDLDVGHAPATEMPLPAAEPILVPAAEQPAPEQPVAELHVAAPHVAEEHFDLDLTLEAPRDEHVLDLDALAHPATEAVEPPALAPVEEIELSLPDAPHEVEVPVVEEAIELHLPEEAEAAPVLDLSEPSDEIELHLPESPVDAEVAEHGVLHAESAPVIELGEPVIELDSVLEEDPLALHLPAAEALPDELVIGLGLPDAPDEHAAAVPEHVEAPVLLAELPAVETDMLTDVPLAPVDEAIVVEHALDADAIDLDVIEEAAPEELVIALPDNAPIRSEEAAAPAPIAAAPDSVGSVMPLATDRRAEITAVDELDEQLLPIFLEEAQELMPQIAAELRALRDDAHNHEALDSLKRVLHTLKGSARMAGAMRLGEATHNLETRLLNAGEGTLSALLDELDLDYDLVVELHDRLVNGEPEQAADEMEAEAVAGVAAAEAVERAAAIAPVAGAARVAAPLGLSDPEAGRSTVRVRADLVDRLVNQAGEVSIARTRIESEMLSLKRSLLDLTDNVGRLRSQLREIEIQAESQMASRLSHTTEMDDFDPLEFDRFSRLQELTRFMAESVNDVATVQHNLLKNLDESGSALQQQSRLTRDLQQELMRVRMVPFSSLSERLYRLVRQTGKETGKKVNLELRGGRVEIDRSVLEKMVSPFEHMLRNAIDHGLETSDIRAKTGKNEFGEILVEARQEGNELVLNLRDDGAGLDLKRIREKGIEKGLIEAGGEYSDSQLMHLIFEAGFSTASAVTQLSGRGIGMDVVKSEIEDLGGRVEVDSVAGQGTTFTIHLPLTLAVTQTVMVKVGEKTYAIPSVMVEQVQELKLPALEKLYQSRMVEWMGNQYPFHYLPRLLGDYDTQPEQKRYNTVVLLRSGIQRIALHLDQLLKNQEVVVKNIGPQLIRVAGVAGATVLGNGEIVLILNPLALAQRRVEAPVADFDAAIAATKATAEEMLQVAPVVMVVDDSLTVRKITGRLLAREGYQVVTAKDGVDALQQLQDVRPAVMLLDVEMPRMDGFELTRNLRANADSRSIPIIMITSRTADKHKNYAFELGVNVFLGKPYQEDELLEHIRRLIGEEQPIA